MGLGEIRGESGNPKDLIADDKRPSPFPISASPTSEAPFSRAPSERAVRRAL
jgi:hypothetical protein